jgi:uncharacterized membrane protein
VTDPSPPSAPPYPHPVLPDAAYRRTAQVLRVGLIAALATLLGALAAYLLANPGATSASVTATNPIVPYLTFAGLAHGLATGTPEAFLTLGIFVLVATPVARVLTGLYYFRQDHEREMTAVTLTVVVMLVLGLLVIGPWIR